MHAFTSGVELMDWSTDVGRDSTKKFYPDCGRRVGAF